MSFETLNIAAPLLRALQSAGYNVPTEIQRQAIPLALTGRDLMASAQTGTGKTAAFLLPALQRLLQPASAKGRGPRVLILTPTRELAGQVLESAKGYGRFTGARLGTIVGGVPYGVQERLLSQPLDLLVATPGRLIDHMDRKRVDFSRLEVLILDEADRMLDMGFIDAVEQIVAATPAKRQSLLFSATLEGSVAKLAARMLRDPERIQIAGVQQKNDQIEQRLHLADSIGHKMKLLRHLLTQDDVKQAIVFTATKAAADNLAADLASDGHATAALHGDMRQSARNRTVQQMRRGAVKVLVATDVAARGLDIQGVSHVINFDLPMVAEDYVHRIGRTGRAGAFGIAISLSGPQDGHNLARIERYTGQQLKRDVIAGLEPQLSEQRRNRKPGNTGRRPDAARQAKGFGRSAERSRDERFPRSADGAAPYRKKAVPGGAPSARGERSSRRAYD